MTTETAMKLVEVIVENLADLLMAVRVAQAGKVDVSALNIPESYYDGLKTKGLTDAEIEELKGA